MGERYKTVIIPNDSEFSEWLVPHMGGYKLACCDCGLVHDMEFAVIEVTEEIEKGKYATVDVENWRFLVKMRAKRNNRSTGQMRRHRK